MAETLLLASLNAGVTSVGTASAISSAISILPSAATVLTAGSAIGSVMSGQQQGAAYKAQARQSELAARQEELRGRQQADEIRRSLQASISAQNAIWGARGISSRTGSPTVLASQSKTAAGRDIETAMYSSGMGAAQERSQAQQLRISGSAAKTAGYVGAAKTIGGSLLS